MIGVVLAAGLGTRLRPLTFLVPKPLVPVHNRAMIDYVVEWLRANGVRRIVVVGGYMGDVLRRYLAEYWPDVEYVQSRRLLGTAGQLFYASHLVDETAVVVNTDVVTNLDLGPVAKLHRETGADMTIVARVVRSRLRFGVLELDGTRLVRWVEKPEVSHVVATGIYLVEPRVIRRLGEEYVDMDALANSLSNVHVYVAREAEFYDLGTLEDLGTVPLGFDVTRLRP